MTDKKITVLQVVDSYYPAVDGVVNVVDNYSATLMQMGSKSLVLCPKYKSYDDSVFTYSVNRCASLRLGSFPPLPLPWLSARAIKELITKQKVEIIHAHSPVTLGKYAVRLARKRGIPVIATFHSKFKDDFRIYTGSKLLAEIATKFVVSFFNSVDEVWTVSNSAADVLRSYGYKGKIVIMRNPTDDYMRLPEDEQMLISRADQCFGKPEKGIRLLFVGQTIWQKNFKMILNTCAILKKRGVDFTLTVAGMGMHHNAIVKLAQELGVAQNVNLIGRVQDKSLLKGLYLRSDLLFFPSLYDTAGMVVQEAASCSKPSLLIEGSSAAEFVENMKSGFTCADHPQSGADIIEYLASHPELVEQVGKCAREHVVVDRIDMITAVKDRYIELASAGKSKS